MMVNPEYFAKLEERQTAVIEAEIKAAIKKAQSLGIDVFKFGTEYHRKFPKEFAALEENWEEEYKNRVVNIEVKTTLKGHGMSSSPPKVRED